MANQQLGCEQTVLVEREQAPQVAMYGKKARKQGKVEQTEHERRFFFLARL
jgi:hypothetical protein